MQRKIDGLSPGDAAVICKNAWCSVKKR
jgi:hypothetical protein